MTVSDETIWNGLERRLKNLGQGGAQPSLDEIVDRPLPGRPIARRAGGAVGLLVVLVAVVLVGGVILQSHPVANVGRAVDGPFTLEITVPNREYVAGAGIPVTASLTYTGPEASVRIGHALQVIGFGVDEFLGGAIRPIWAFKCGSSLLQRGVPLVVPFAKTGGMLTPNPSFMAYFADPVLRLPPGTWHVYAEASFSEQGCNDIGRDMRAEVVITVTPP
jgi:hypothetical protein